MKVAVIGGRTNVSELYSIVWQHSSVEVKAVQNVDLRTISPVQYDMQRAKCWLAGCWVGA